MLRKVKEIIGKFFQKTTTVNDEPLNKVSIILIIIMDIFILSNVFMGLNDISRFYINPSQAHPCYSIWQNYRESIAKDKDYTIINSQQRQFQLDNNSNNLTSQYQDINQQFLGSVNDICFEYATLKDKFQLPTFQNIFKEIDDKLANIRVIEQENNTIRQQYDSTLLEEIAEQPRELSINQIEARKAKETLLNNQAKINSLQGEIDQKKQTLYSLPESKKFLDLLNSDAIFQQLEKDYQRANFWYPTIQITFQLLFLLPLIAIALWVNLQAEKAGNGQVALISWHLLVIFFIPLVVKIFQFLQVGIIFKFVFNTLSLVLGGFLFLVSYLYIFIIPLITFGLIKFCQKVVFNKRSQASKRVQKSKCLNCAKKIPPQAPYCPHCGYSQYIECPNCHNMTYKHLPYCFHCGNPQTTDTN